MPRCSRAAAFGALSILWCAASASAETMRCQSVNGNLNCAGSGGVSCQTINGKQVCVSGHGDVVQSFGNGAPSDWSGHDSDKGDGSDDLETAPEIRLDHGHSFMLQRGGTKLHLQTDWMSIDRD